MEKWYWINLSYACYGIKVKNEIIIEAAPIANWALGKNINYFLNWVKNKRGEWKELSWDASHRSTLSEDIEQKRPTEYADEN